MIGYDAAFALINIVAISAGVVVVVTWWPAARLALTQGNRLVVTAAGVTGLAFGMVATRVVSLAFRTFKAFDYEPWLIATVALECLFCMILAGAYYMPAASREATPIHYRGLWCGGVAFVALMLAWSLFNP